MMMNHGKIFGTTSIGERGQVVIPSEAREELGIKSGEKFLVLTIRKAKSPTNCCWTFIL